MEKRIYKSRNGSDVGSEEIQKVGEFIFEKCQGMTSEQILEQIRQHPENPAYNHIEWDDTKASRNYRIQQVSVIIHSITIEIQSVGETKPIRCFYNVRESADNPVRVWNDISVVVDDAFMKQQILDRAKHELEYWTDKYSVYAEFFDIIKPIKKFLKK